MTARIDLRIDDDLLEKIQEIARDRFKAKLHHISGKPEITSTLVKLIQYGIESLESGLYTDNNTDNEPIRLPDSYLDQIAEKVLKRILPNLSVSNLDSYLDNLVSAAEATLYKRFNEFKDELQPILDNQQEFEQLMGK